MFPGISEESRLPGFDEQAPIPQHPQLKTDCIKNNPPAIAKNISFDLNASAKIRIAKNNLTARMKLQLLKIVFFKK